MSAETQVLLLLGELKEHAKNQSERLDGLHAAIEDIRSNCAFCTSEYKNHVRDTDAHGVREAREAWKERAGVVMKALGFLAALGGAAVGMDKLSSALRGLWRH